MWRKGQLSIADEHVGTEIAKPLMGEYDVKINSNKKANKVA
jgi:hypothetical protein